ncbi:MULTISPECIES: cytochrome c oxidase subunit II [Ramlibacter]|uniref:Cytochrome c oxidase subunit 2 n=1 Tax=Ramlibacter pinisoli TaxID=2682844 RepID=A0A6N8IV97_9BURK|nr:MULTISPECIES: cytochrome c oxidase subunit II [Ramlibacter]MBA2965095.1 cytochrome c oxidase subunit II [Ramlibacter sp. CGMCC 1.13660]MVQ30060.1 cytochrome c oxidase subunit II [Ramlibacter pinisoli]
MKSLSTMARALALAAAASAGAAHAVNDLPGGPGVRQLNLPAAATRIAVEQSWLHWFMLITCTVIFVAVFSVMFYSIWKHRKSVGHKPANFHESVTVEVIWTLVPFLIVIGMALPATKVLVAAKDTSNADLTIKATGYQWKWGYDYLNGEGSGLSFLSTLLPTHREISNAGAKADVPDNYLFEVDNPLVVPVNKKVRIITTANDVIHAWGVPAFGVKQDAIPGFVRDTWFRSEKTGDFYGNCYELCGKEHAYMPIHVKVVTAQEYTAWVGDQQKRAAAKQDDPNKVWQLSDIVTRGEKVYAANCAACHQPNGKGAGPIKALDGSPIVQDADKSKQLQVVLNGKGAMPAWKQLSDTDIAAVVSYTKNNWSNKTGQVVQPSEVLAQRGK